MKKEEMFELLGEIDEASVKEAGEYSAGRKPQRLRFGILAACAALVLLAVFGIPAVKKARNGEGSIGVIKVMAAYPEAVAEGMSPEAFMESDTHWEWWRSYWGKIKETNARYDDLDEYDRTLMKEILTGDDENTVCSPLNTYIAFAMLAEVSDGNTRKQILDFLKVPDVETLREKISVLWENNYVDTPVLKSLLANSVWLNNSMNYKEDTLKTLAENYYASSFLGTPGSEEMNEALRDWTDENTGGLLQEFTKDMYVSKDLVMDLVSTIYYKAMWLENFPAENTSAETFHGTKGDTEVQMMHKAEMTGVYQTDTFTAVSQNLTDSGAMYFYLPKEGVEVDDLLSDPDLFQALRGGEENENLSYPLVTLSIPKFRVSAKTDLLKTLAALGITDALDPQRSDFTPLTADRDDIYLAKADHAAMIEIDEQGVTGAAYTELEVDGAGATTETMEFVLDRPFLFIVTGKDGSVLFSGIIRNIVE